MSIAYDSGPPRTTRRVASAPGSLLNRIQKPALADRLSQDDSSTTTVSTYVLCLLLYDPLNTHEPFDLKEEPQGRSVLDEVEQGLLPGAQRNRRRQRIWIRSWICSWEMFQRIRIQLLLRRLLLLLWSRKQMLKWLNLAPRNCVSQHLHR
jgi:hypothetical protein